MAIQQPTIKQLLVNISITLLILVTPWIYGDGWLENEILISDFWKGIIILIILSFGIIAGIREILELRYHIKSHLGWFFLSLLATAGHIMLYISAMEYLGHDISEGKISGTANKLLIIGSLIFTFYFLFEILFIMSHEIFLKKKTVRKYSWSDFILSVYAAFGGIYIWDILLGDVGFKMESPTFFLFGELFPAIVLFLLLILPFKRYHLMESHGFSKSSKEKMYLFLSYLFLIAAAIVPRILESGQ